MSGRRSLAASAGAMVAVSAACAALAPIASPREPLSAAVFVAPSGSDTRFCGSKAVPCASFDQAYRAARPGEVIEVAAGRYPAQKILAVAGRRTGPSVVFRPVPGARVVLGDLSFGADGDAALGPAFVTVERMTTATKGTPPGARNQSGIFVGPGSSHITLEDMDAGSIDTWRADHVTVRGGDFGPCDVIAGSPNVCGNSKLDISTNVTIVGATFHDYRFDETCFSVAGADCHWECLYVNAGSNITIKDSKFRDCAIADVFATISGPDAARLGHRNLTIENNWFDTPWTETPSGGARARPTAVSLAWCQNSELGYRDVLVRFNSFQRNTGIELDRNPACAWENVRVVGNLLMYPGSCDSRVTYAYNLWSTAWRRGRCSATDRIVGDGFPYTNPVSGTAFDFTLSDTRKTAADDRVPTTAPGGCPRRDIQGQRRPAGKRCDAGADERLRTGPINPRR